MVFKSFCIFLPRTKVPSAWKGLNGSYWYSFESSCEVQSDEYHHVSVSVTLQLVLLYFVVNKLAISSGSVSPYATDG